jgi:hypothetical protein
MLSQAAKRGSRSLCAASGRGDHAASAVVAFTSMLNARARRAGLAIGLCVIAPAGCGPSNGTCVESLPAECAPLYTPTFDQVFTRTLQPTCAQSGGVCHSADGAQGGLVFADADAAYALLLGKTDGKARVVAGDPACSLLVERIESADSTTVMPPGSMLSAGERCAIETWIRDGAKR